MFRTGAQVFAGDDVLTERQGAVLLASSGVVFSFGAVVFRGVESAGDWQFLTYRGASAAIAMIVLTLLRRRSRPVRFRNTTWKAGLAGVLLASMAMLYILALARTTAANTLFLQAASPVAAAGFGWLVLRERVDRSTFAAMVVAGVGVAVMVGAGFEAGSKIGVVLAAVIPLVLGLYSVVLRTTVETDPVIPALIGATVLTVGAGAISIAGEGLDVSSRDVLLGCISGGLLLGIGLPLFNLGTRSVPAAKVPMLLMTEVVLAPLWVWVWPGETPGAGTFVGGAIVIGAVVWLLQHATHTDGDVVALSIPPG